MSTLPLAAPDFRATLESRDVDLSRRTLRTLQINLTKLCNQACLHCHVDSSPKRTEHLSPEGVERSLELLKLNPGLEILDLTGGAPELHAQFRELVEGARALGRRVIVRHNLTVTLDPHPVTQVSMEGLPEFFAAQEVELVSSLPFYEQYFTDKQRGRGVFGKSLESLRRLNEVGFGMPDTGLELTLVYNPVGAYLPPDQATLEADYRSKLRAAHGLEFNNLFAITNMPINRFADDLRRRGNYDDYLQRLVAAFNPVAASNVMCRDMISVDHRGQIYDCDFNQMLELEVSDAGSALTIFNVDFARLAEIPIQVGSHCFGCTAGSGSSCGGTTE
ncbi:MAG: arsenosugar biosynthesis radical SAM protein ArsS [Planctomycetes bacterium]|nr:arsenosugar biosynthesis radical SAM protein ArsS [Planctomycetota bacterium]